MSKQIHMLTRAKWVQKSKFRKFKTADGRHFENGRPISLYLRESSDFDEIWCCRCTVRM